MTVCVQSLAPTFVLPDLEGRPCRLEGVLEQGPVLLAFVRDQCATSELLLRMLTAVAREHAGHVSPEGSSLSIWVISQEDAQGSRRLLERLGLELKLLVDGDALAVSRQYAISETPCTLLLAGRERLQSDADTVPSEESRRVLAATSGWDKREFDVVLTQIAGRIAALPAEPYGMGDGTPEHSPGSDSRTLGG